MIENAGCTDMLRTSVAQRVVREKADERSEDVNGNERLDEWEVRTEQWRCPRQ